MDLASWFGVAILVAAFAFIPLSAWAATDSWERAWEAVRQYLGGMAIFVIVGGGFGLVAAIADHGLMPLLRALMPR